MKKILMGLICLAVLVMAYSFVGTNSVSAAPALTGKGTGCGVTGDGLNYYYDPNCTAHEVLKFDDEGNFQFYEYQDQGQLPEGIAPPSQAFRNSFEQCLDFGSGLIVCGTGNEIVTPSGEYKSSFRSN